MVLEFHAFNQYILPPSRWPVERAGRTIKHAPSMLDSLILLMPVCHRSPHLNGRPSTTASHNVHSDT